MSMIIILAFMFLEGSLRCLANAWQYFGHIESLEATETLTHADIWVREERKEYKGINRPDLGVICLQWSV